MNYPRINALFSILIGVINIELVFSRWNVGQVQRLLLMKVVPVFVEILEEILVFAFLLVPVVERCER